MNELEKLSEGKDKVQKYIYQDNFQNGKVVFECIANNIVEADEEYKKTIGKDVSKQPNIACRWEDIKEKETEKESFKE